MDYFIQSIGNYWLFHICEFIMSDFGLFHTNFIIIVYCWIFHITLKNMVELKKYDSSVVYFYSVSMIDWFLQKIFHIVIHMLTVVVPEIWNTLEIKKNENLLRSPKFYGKNEFPVEMCISQLITEILSFFCFHKNFMTNLSFQIAKKWSWVQHFWRYSSIWLTP